MGKEQKAKIYGKFNSIAFILNYIGAAGREGRRMSKVVLNAPYSFSTTRTLIMKNPDLFEVIGDKGRRGFTVRLTKFGEDLLKVLKKHNFKFME